MESHFARAPISGECPDLSYRRATSDPLSAQSSPSVLAVEMPQPGEVCPGFMAQPNRCWRMVYSHTMQATHCREPANWTGRWFTPKSDRWWRVWACERHLDG